jgi:IS5 family transposase
MFIYVYPAEPDFLSQSSFPYDPPPTLVQLDHLLADPRLLMLVSLDLMKSAPHALETGRPALPAEVSLRLAVVRRMQGWSYATLETEVAGSLQWRWFCRLYDHPMPDQSTIRDREVLIKARTLHRLTDWTVQLGQEQAVTQGRKLRSDSSVVETHIHYPTDNSLLADGVRILGRLLTRAKTLVDGRTVRWRKSLFRNHTRRARRLARLIAQLARQSQWEKSLKSAAKRAEMRKHFRRLVAVAETTVTQVQAVIPLLTSHGRSRAEMLVAGLEHFVALMQQVISQARRGVLEGKKVPASEKVVSLFEPHTAVIRRGLAAPHTTEFGRKVWFSEVDGGLISDYQIQQGSPPDNQMQWKQSLDHHQYLFGHAPQLATGDRGVHSAENEAMAHAAGVDEVALPKPGPKTAERQALERLPWFKAALRFRAGIEGRISVLRGPRGLRRCLNRGENGMDRWVGWGIIANNLAVTAMTLARRRHKKKPTALRRE